MCLLTVISQDNPICLFSDHNNWMLLSVVRFCVFQLMERDGLWWNQQKCFRYSNCFSLRCLVRGWSNCLVYGGPHLVIFRRHFVCEFGILHRNFYWFLSFIPVLCINQNMAPICLLKWFYFETDYPNFVLCTSSYCLDIHGVYSFIS